MIKSVKIIIICISYLASVSAGYTQNQLDKKVIPFSKISLSSKWDINIIDSNTIEYAFTDTIDLCWVQDLSPIRNYCSDTLTPKTFRAKILFENGWSKKRIKNTKSENEIKIDKIRIRLIDYGDSLNWKLPKTNRKLVESRPLNYIRFKTVAKPL